MGFNQSDYLEGKRILDLGCGRSKLEGAVGLDMFDLPGVDVVCDLKDGIPLADESFDVVWANQLLEHVPDLISLVYEIYRVLKPGGRFIAHCPYFRSSWAWIDPTHIRGLTVNSLDYFCKGNMLYDGYRFRDYGFDRITVVLDRQEKPTILRRLMIRACLRNPMRFENTVLSSLYPFQEVTYILEKGIES